MLGQRTATWATALVLLAQSISVLSLRITPGSPCEEVCHRHSSNTTGSEIACLDREFTQTEKGSTFQQCVECGLRSSFHDTPTKQSDVEWSLYNLRYAFTSCVFGTPESVSNISTQCTVSCQQLDSALEFEIADPDGDNLDTWCGSNAFADNAISQCEQCYNLTDNQNYMSNFLEALRYNCHFRTPPTQSFPISPARIFSESMLPSSTANLLAPKSGNGVNLAVVIAIPILAFIIVVCALTVCCFFFVRHRRKKARQLREERELNRFHAGWGGHPHAHALAQGQVQQDTYDPAAAVGMHHPYAYGSGGVGVGYGYGKQQAHVTETGVAVPGTVYAPEKEEKDKGPVKG